MTWTSAVQAMCSLGLGCALIVVTDVRAHPRESQVMWTTDIEPIVRSRCAGCHVDGGFAPMSLTSYDDARKWGEAIATEVLERRMPPWSAAPGFAQYANDRSLSLSEVEMLVSWGTGGTPRGPDMPHAEAHAATATPRRPDLVLAAPAQAVTSARQRVELSTTLTEDRWIRGWAFTPGAASVVARATVSIEPGGVLGTWTPPEGATMFPDDVGMRLKAGARVVLDVEYRRSARTHTDSSSVALYFHRGRVRERRVESFACGSAALPGAIDVLSVTARASAAQASLEVFATRPDGTLVPLTIIPSFHPQYARTYRLRTPAMLPRQSQLYVRSSAADCAADVEWVPPTRAR